MKRRGVHAVDEAEGVLEAIQQNAALDCRRWSREQCERLLARNPSRRPMVTPRGVFVVDQDAMYSQGALLRVDGIDSTRLPELRAIGLTAIKAANTYWYEGRRIIAFLCGNAPALDRIEFLDRTGQ